MHRGGLYEFTRKFISKFETKNEEIIYLKCKFKSLIALFSKEIK